MSVEPSLQRRRLTFGRVLAVGTVVVLVAMWAYAFSGLARREPPDRLDGRAFPRAAEAVCGPTADRVEGLAETEATTPAERAALVARGTDLLHTMVDELGRRAPAGGRDGRLVRLWLADWETYLSDRGAYVGQLRQDVDARFLLTEKAGGAITEPIDNFATVNDMESCATPLDV